MKELSIPEIKKNTAGPAARLCLAAVMLLVLLPVMGYGAELIQLEQISSPDESRVLLQLNGRTRFTMHTLPANGDLPERCYIDLHQTSAGPRIPPQISVSDANISTVRTGAQGSALRVVIDLQEQRRCESYQGSEVGQIIMSVTPHSSVTAPELTPETAPDPQPEPATTALPQENALQLATQPSLEPLNLAGLSAVPETKYSLWGRVLGFAAHDLKKNEAEDHQLLRLRSRLGIQHNNQLTENLRLQGRAAMEWDLLDYDNHRAGTDSDLNLYEAYLRLSGAWWDLSVGKQRVRWGKSDQLSPLDNINPDDLRQFITLDLEDRKIPSWLTQLRLHGSNFSIEAIVSPWFEKSELDYFDSDWALYRNLRQAITSNQQLPQPIKDYAANLRVNERQPSDSLHHMSGALKLAWSSDRTDFAVSYRYGWETLPTIISFPVKNINFNGDPDSNPAEFLQTAILTNEKVEARYKRQQVVGFEWETVLDRIGFRGEIAYVDHVSFLTSDLTSAGKEVAHLVAGIDYTTDNEWYFNLQTSWHRILNYNDNILYFERDNLSLLGEIRKTLWRGNLEVATGYNYMLSDGSSYLQPSITLKYFPNTDIEIGGMIFSGDGDTLFGSYDEADQVYTQVKVSF